MAIERTALSLLCACVALFALVVAAVQLSRWRRWCWCQRYTCGVCRAFLLCKPTAAGGPSPSSYASCTRQTENAIAACKKITARSNCTASTNTTLCTWCGGGNFVVDGCYLVKYPGAACQGSDGYQYQSDSCPNGVKPGSPIDGVLIGIVGARPHSRLAAAAPPSSPYRQSSSPLPACTLSARVAGQPEFRCAVVAPRSDVGSIVLLLLCIGLGVFF